MDYLVIFNIVLLIIILIIILIIVFKEKKENFIGSTIESSTLKIINVLTGVDGNQYSTIYIENEQVIVFRQNSEFVIPDNMPNCKLLIIGGGGGGRSSTPGSGGGAGACIYLTNITLSQGNYSVIIGNGGSPNENGGDTSISLEGSVIYLAKGGGGGELIGGSNGGGDLNSNNDPVSLNTPSGRFGNKGGINNFYTVTVRRNSRRVSYIDYKYAGGGGGAGGAGVNGSNSTPGNGGAGIQNDITGTNVTYAAGGGGGSYVNDEATGLNPGSGGSGIGGNGGRGNIRSNSEASSGVQNTGSGGGGAGKIVFRNQQPINAAGSGGSGIVIIRYTPIIVPIPPSEGRVISETDLNISPPELRDLNIIEIPDNYFGEVSQITENNNSYSQTARTFSVYPDLIPITNFTISYSSYDTTMQTPAFLFGYPPSESEGRDTSSYFTGRRYTPSTGDFISSPTVNRININITKTINNTETTYNNLTLIDTNNNPLTGIRELKGEFIKITCPELITVVGYHFVANLAFENQAPGAWVLLARNTNNLGSSSAYKILDSSEVDSNNEFIRNSWQIYQNRQQMKRCFIQNNRESFNEYLFIFPKLASTDIRGNLNYGHQLIFKEIKLYKLTNDN